MILSPGSHQEVPVDMLHRLLICDPDAGKLWWRERTPDLFNPGSQSRERACKAWNTRWAGKEAICSASGSHGYLDGAILSVGVLAHRVIFAMVKGYWPVGVDHENGNRRDNRFCNLKEASQAENMLNLKIRSDNKSGHAGVWELRRGGWRARIKRGGVQHDLGRFNTLDEALTARREAARDLGFHKNHGRAA